MRLGTLTAIIAGIIVSCGSAAKADTTPTQTLSLTQPDTWRPGFGARIGGYGFREGRGMTEIWRDCRMDGVGLMGTLELSPHVFGELGLDFYQATTLLAKDHDMDMDRVSMHTTAAIGLRMLPGAFITPYIQVGGGVEWTQVTEEGAEHTGWSPTAFMGIGGEANLSDHLKLGMGIRFHAMEHPDHGEGGHDHAAGVETFFPEPKAHKVTMSYAPAAQALGFIRYAL